MTFRRFCAFSALSVVILCLWTQVPVRGAGTPLDNREHPRLWLSSSTIPELKTRLAGAQRPQFQEFVKFLDSEFASVTGSGDYYYGIRNYGFLYALGPVSGVSYGHSQAQYGAKAAELLRALAADARGVAASEGDAHVQLMAAGYDWCYSLLSASDKAAVVSRLKEIASKPYGPGSNRNSFHHREIKERMLYILAGLAYANDGIDDADAAARLATYSTHIAGDGGTFPAENFVAATDGGVSVGLGYTVNGASDGLSISGIQFNEAWRTANGLSRDAVFAPNNNFRYFPQWVAYMVMPFKRPDGMRVLYSTHQTERGTPAWMFADLPVTVSAGRLYKDIDPKMAGLAEWLAQNQTGLIGTSGTLARRSAVLGDFIFNPGGVTPQSPESLGLPLTKLFRGLGWLVMRTGWTDEGDTVVTLSASPFTRKPSYANNDHGAFTIDRNGPLAVNAGTGAHHPFQESTRAYNTITFTDPNEPVGSWPEYWDMGGQRLLFSIPRGISEMVKSSQWDIGGIKRQDLFNGEQGHDYDYVQADLTRGFNGPANTDAYNTAKVRLYTRQLVNFRRLSSGTSDQIIVFDRTESVGAQFEKRWLLHPPGRQDGARSFAVTGHSGVSPGPSRSGSTAGKQTYMQPDVVTVTNTDNGSNGRLFWKPLLPANRILVEVGGPDSTGKYMNAASHEFEDGYGKQQSSGGTYYPHNSQYVGHYTLELQPAVKTSLAELFLNVLEVTTPAQPALSTTALISGTRTVGASIGNRMAIFNRSEGYISSDAFPVARAATYKVLFGDLQPGMGYNINGQVVTASQGGTAYVTLSVGAGGTISIAATGTVTALAPAAPTGVRIVPNN